VFLVFLADLVMLETQAIVVLVDFQVYPALVVYPDFQATLARKVVPDIPDLKDLQVQ
jgi:hypothetical protein